ncbi:MAG: hypothetical protein E7572_03985 [Ruminococcaceae bacterium]|nr:hypothetical protein [Oscillospiraceae bacterium]
MSDITISPDVEKPGTMLVETGWIEQLADDAQVLHEMMMALEITLDKSDYGKFVGVIRERMTDLANQLEQIADEGGVRE